jgi:hypothetical protein
MHLKRKKIKTLHILLLLHMFFLFLLLEIELKHDLIFIHFFHIHSNVCLFFTFQIRKEINLEKRFDKSLTLSRNVYQVVYFMGNQIKRIKLKQINLSAQCV